MKKTLVVMMAFVLGIAVTSCKQGQKAEGAVNEAEEVEEVATAGNPTEVITSLVEKAKSEGANWTVDQWKDAYKQAFTVMVPFMKGLQEVAEVIKTNNKANGDTAAIAAAIKKAQVLGNEFKPIEDIIHQFDSISSSYPNGKAVEEDKEYRKQLLKEFGISEEYSK